MIGVARAPMKRLTPAAEPAPFRMQPRDLEILRFTALNRFVTAHQAARHVGGSPRNVANRMKAMFDHHFLDRPQHQYALRAAFTDYGNLHLVYAIGRLGARLLAKRGDPINDRLDWTAKNARPVALTLTHEVEVTEAVLAFQMACRDAGITFIDQHQLPTPHDNTDLTNAFKCEVTNVDVPWLKRPIERLVNVPDRVFAHEHADNARHNFILEWDRGSMVVGGKRTPLIGKASIIKKQIGYFTFFKRGLHVERWGMKRWRVLVITTKSDQRVASMLNAQKLVTNGNVPGLFLYSTIERLNQHGVLGPAWVSAKRDGVSLTDRED
jgi:hypothetical protein